MLFKKKRNLLLSINNLFLVFLLSITGKVTGQELKPRGQFLQDTVKIGEEVAYALAFKYPREMQVIFPDSGYNFTPFEFLKKEYFQTKSDSSSSYDSVVYYLSTFEIEKIQSVSLPVFLISKGDSTAIYATKDSVILKETVNTIPADVKLKSNTAAVEVPAQLNYPYLLIGLGVLIVFIVLMYLLLGKAVLRNIKLKRMEKAHRKFMEKFNLHINSLKSSADVRTIEDVVLFWKTYMERLEAVPYKKLTTRELLSKNINIPKEPLKNIDRSIYANLIENDIEKNFIVLKDFTINRYLKKVKEVQNAK